MQIVILEEQIMTISIKFRGTELFKNRDYNFFSKENWLLKSKGGFFAHITDFEMIAMQMKNIFKKSYIIFRNFKLGQLRDYNEKNCFLAFSKDCHLAVISGKRFNLRETFGNIPINLENKAMETMLSNDITMYEDQNTVKKLTAITEATSRI